MKSSRIVRSISAALIGILFAGCHTLASNLDTEEDVVSETIGVMKDSIRFLALGDSYTIGESVPASERWPVVLGDRLEAANFQIDTVQIIATTGWTTGELADGIALAAPKGSYDIVSLLIGVNNQYRGNGKGFTLSSYKQEFEGLLKQAIAFAGGQSEKVFVVSIPDYGVTPFAQSRNPEQIAKEIDAYNAAAENICRQYEVTYYNITPISREAGQDLSLVASDQLHPSGKMYQRWVDEVIFPNFILPIN